jgi:hypothetical protein
VDLERLPRQGALDEAGDDHPVRAALARADGVEEADDHAVEPALLVVGEREELVHRLGVGVGPSGAPSWAPAARRRGPADAAGVLRERRLVPVVAVHLRGRGDEDALPEAVRVLQHHLRPAHVREQGAHGLLDDEADADRRGQVRDDVALVDQLTDDRGREDGVDDEVEVPALPQVGDVVQRAGRRSSRAYTSQPVARSASQRCEPMKPAPPVTRALGRVECGSTIRGC